jgi:hypothetical protein
VVANSIGLARVVIAIATAFALLILQTVHDLSVASAQHWSAVASAVLHMQHSTIMAVTMQHASSFEGLLRHIGQARCYCYVAQCKTCRLKALNEVFHEHRMLQHLSDAYCSVLVHVRQHFACACSSFNAIARMFVYITRAWYAHSVNRHSDNIVAVVEHYACNTLTAAEGAEEHDKC